MKGIGSAGEDIQIELETERLVLRQWRDEDLEPFARINSDPEVMRHLTGGDPMTLQQTLDLMTRARRHWRDHGFGWFATELRATSAFIGFIGLSRPEFLPEIMPAVEVGWRLDRSVWSRGLATEGAQACLRFGFEDLGLDRIVSIRHAGNGASGRVMEKLGMTLDRTTVLPSKGWPLEVHAITREQWEAGA